MIGLTEALKLNDLKELENEIRERRTLLSTIKGIVPVIIADEIHKLFERYHIVEKQIFDKIIGEKVVFKSSLRFHLAGKSTKSRLQLIEPKLLSTGLPSFAKGKPTRAVENLIKQAEKEGYTVILIKN
jgi:hypothetical protein